MNQEIPTKLPLEGIRVVDFTQYWAGPMVTSQLADLGAQVIKVESARILDGWRRSGTPHGEQAWNRSCYFNSVNRNKFSLALEVDTEKGKEIFKALVQVSDVVVENMRAGTMGRIGLGYEELRRVNPKIIMLGSSARGATGPESHYAGYATVHHAVGGAAEITGYPDGPPSTTFGDVDLMNATASAFAVIAALKD